LNIIQQQYEDQKIEEVKDVKTKPGGPVVAIKKDVKTAPYWFEDGKAHPLTLRLLCALLTVMIIADIGSNNSGYYELQAVLTHKGRSSGSGHYVAWTKKQGTNQWLQLDDDKVTPISEEDVLKLSGGGDWHCAYVLLYGPRLLELEDAAAGEKMDTTV